MGTSKDDVLATVEVEKVLAPIVEASTQPSREFPPPELRELSAGSHGRAWYDYMSQQDAEDNKHVLVVDYPLTFSSYSDDFPSNEYTLRSTYAMDQGGRWHGLEWDVTFSPKKYIPLPFLQRNRLRSTREASICPQARKASQGHRGTLLHRNWLRSLIGTRWFPTAR